MKAYITNHLNYKRMNFSKDEREVKLKLGDLEKLIRKENEDDIFISSIINISQFGSESEELNILGASKLIDTYNLIDEKKLDLTYKFEHVEYMGITDKEELIFKFYNEELDDTPLVASGIYEFSNMIADEKFKMGKFSRFCIKENHLDLLKDNFHRLFQEYSNFERQYRFIRKNDDWFIRSVTSKGYKNYDNNIALYIMLGMLHSISKRNELKFTIHEAHVSDSALRIYVDSNKKYKINNDLDIRIGLFISNGEIKDSQFTCSINYAFYDKKHNYNFSLIETLEDSFVNIKHNTKLENFVDKVKDFNKFSEINSSMISYVSNIYDNKEITEEILYRAMKEITDRRKQNVEKETAKNIQDLYDKKLINNTCTLIEGLGDIVSLVSNIEEKIVVERIYYKLLKSYF